MRGVKPNTGTGLNQSEPALAVHQICAAYNNADPSLPDATSLFQSALHFFMLFLNFLSPSVLKIHVKSRFSSSGTKKEESRERMVSKFAEDDVI